MLLPMWVRRPPNSTATNNGWVNEHGVVVYPIKGLVDKITELKNELDFFGPGLFDCLAVEVTPPVTETETETKPNDVVLQHDHEHEQEQEPEPDPEQKQRKKPGPKPKNRRNA